MRVVRLRKKGLATVTQRIAGWLAPVSVTAPEKAPSPWKNRIAADNFFDQLATFKQPRVPGKGGSALKNRIANLAKNRPQDRLTRGLPPDFHFRARRSVYCNEGNNEDEDCYCSVGYYGDSWHNDDDGDTDRAQVSCTKCSTGNYCKGGSSGKSSAQEPWTTCSATQFQSTTPSFTTDRGCTTCNTCPAGQGNYGGE